MPLVFHTTRVGSINRYSSSYVLRCHELKALVGIWCDACLIGQEEILILKVLWGGCGDITLTCVLSSILCLLANRVQAIKETDGNMFIFSLVFEALLGTVKITRKTRLLF